jgi:hypothetical protein
VLFPEESSEAVTSGHVQSGPGENIWTLVGNSSTEAGEKCIMSILLSCTYLSADITGVIK